MNGKIRITFFLSGITLLIGILSLGFGIKGLIETNIVSRDYEVTEGYLYDYEIYSKGGYSVARKKHKNDTYRLIYQYQVDGQKYEVSTDIGVGVVPEKGSVKEIQYNPDNPSEAFIAGPNSNIFKIFFGLFFIVISSIFIWILMPVKSKVKKQPKQISTDRLGIIIGLGLLFFSYGSLYFITGELSLFSIVNFYKTSFILPMVIPVLLFLAGGYLFIKSIFINHQKAARICMFGSISLLTIMIGFTLWSGDTNQNKQSITKKIDFTTVHNLLTEKNFETANIPTTYWFHDENKLTNVVAGNKNDAHFEFYEYTDGNTTDAVYNSIIYDISPDLENTEREKYETNLQGEGKMFSLVKEDIYNIVIYKDNIVIYTYFQEGQNEIQDILTQLGYTK